MGYLLSVSLAACVQEDSLRDVHDLGDSLSHLLFIVSLCALEITELLIKFFFSQLQFLYGLLQLLLLSLPLLGLRLVVEALLLELFFTQLEFTVSHASV